MVLVGAGGILAELIADTALAAAPITPDQAEALLHRLKVDRLLEVTAAPNLPTATR